MSDLSHAFHYVFSAKPEAWVGIVGTLSGVVISAAIAFVSGLVKEIRGEKQERKKAAIFFIYRLASMDAEMRTIHAHFSEGVERARKMNAQPGLIVRPLSKVDDPIQFSDENIWILSKICGAAGLNSFGNLDRKYNTVIHAAEYFSKRHFQIFEKMPPPTAAAGNTLQFDLSSDDHKKILPLLIDIEDTLQSIMEFSAANQYDIFMAMKSLVQGKKFPYQSYRIEINNPKDPGENYIATKNYGKMSLWEQLLSHLPIISRRFSNRSPRR